MKKTILIVLAVVSFSTALWSQGTYSGKGTFNGTYNRALFNFLYHKQKPYYFGISLGLNNNNFLLSKSNYFVNNDSITVAEPTKGFGLHVQMIINLKIGQSFDFRLLPGFSFSDRKIDYYSGNLSETETQKRIESVYVEAPFLIRYKSAPYRDMRMFAVSGVKYTYDVNNNSRARNNQYLIKISPHDFQFEIGAGLQMFFPYFIFSPELKFSTGIGNVLLYDEALKESKVLEKVLTHTFTISMHFEG
jgi:hypothetical protein